MTIQTFKKELEALKQQVAEHCMAAAIDTRDDRLLVVFPPGYRIDGVRASFGIGKIEAYKRVLAVMEKTWKQDLTI